MFVIRGRVGSITFSCREVQVVQIVRALRFVQSVWDQKPGNAAGVGEIDVFAVLCPFVGENASEPLQVSNELSPLHLHLDLFDHYLVFG